MSDDDPIENYVTMQKLATIIGCQKSTALNYIRSGKIRAVLIGGTYRIYESEVRRFLSQGNHPDPIPIAARPKRKSTEQEDYNA